MTEFMTEIREGYSQLILLITIHCLADYPLQGDFLANMKEKNYFLLLVHCFIWSGMVYGGFYLMGLTNNPAVFNSLFIGHLFVDKWKCERTDKTKALTTDLYIDQALHVTQIIITFILLKLL